jgi:hypothetical protein
MIALLLLPAAVWTKPWDQMVEWLAPRRGDPCHVGVPAGLAWKIREDRVLTSRVAALAGGAPLSREARLADASVVQERLRPRLTRAAQCRLEQASELPVDVVLAAHGLGLDFVVPADLREPLLIAVTDGAEWDLAERHALGAAMIGRVGGGSEAAELTAWAIRQHLYLAGEDARDPALVRGEVARGLELAVASGGLSRGEERKLKDRFFQPSPEPVPAPGCEPVQRAALDEAVKRAADRSLYVRLLPASSEEAGQFFEYRAALGRAVNFHRLSCM